MFSLAIDLTGQVFGSLTVLEREGSDKEGKAMWRCSCTCGTVRLVRGKTLRNGDITNCGCLKKARFMAMVTKHGLCTSHEYKSWYGMLTRCNNPNQKSFKYYGGRGITVCESWKEFKNFIHDMGRAPKGYSIDRIDNEKGYFKENCRWASDKEQARNSRNNTVLTMNGVSRCLAEWSEILGIKRETISMRIRRGSSVEEALTKPLRVWE